MGTISHMSTLINRRPVDKRKAVNHMKNESAPSMATPVATERVDPSERKTQKRRLTSAGSKGNSTRARVHDPARAHAAEEGEQDGEQSVVARLDQLERKQFRVVDQLDPDGRQDDGGTELAVQAL
jgi:uncharacterized membrane protein